MAFRKMETTGRFIAWREVGQVATLTVTDYDPVGGEDYNGNKVPKVLGTLTEPATTFGKKDDGFPRQEVASGETVAITGGNASLRKGLLMADPKRGDLLRVSFTGTYPTDKGNDGKAFTVELDDGSDGEEVEI
jgi:hypothetical protein